MYNQSLPPGQREIVEFPQFGKKDRSSRLPENPVLQLTLRGDAESEAQVTASDLKRLPRIDQTSDFHCVTTWSHRELRWGGVRFMDFYEQILVPLICPESSVRLVIFHSMDGYHTSL